MEQLIIGVFEQGFIYAVMALGVYITYKILDFPDLSVDSTFPLGAAITTVLLMNGFNPVADPFNGGGSGSRGFDRDHPRKVQSQGSAVRYHYDDGTLYDQSADYRGKCQCASVQLSYDF